MNPVKSETRLRLFLRWCGIGIVAVSAFFLGPPSSAQPPRLSPEGRKELIRQRTEWFYQQRSYPGGIPSGARLQAWEAVQKMRARSPRAPSAPSWLLIGPQGGFVSGRVTALAVDPTNSSVVYLGAADGGVWKTTDGGANWTPLTDSQASLSTGSIAIDPSNPQIIYVGTGDPTGKGYQGVGILKSTNGGANWNLTPGPFAGPSDDYGGPHPLHSSPS